MINFRNYNVAYDQTKAIYSLVSNDGMQIVKDLNTLNTNLASKWNGPDAELHINNLVNIQNNLNKYMVNASDMAIEVSDRVVDVQTVVHSISGGAAPGEKLDEILLETNSEEVSSDESYTVESLSDESTLLNQICTDFLNFKTKYCQYFDSFFGNWKNDPKKERIQGIFDDFTSVMDGYSTQLEDARQALETVVATNAQIGVE